MISPECQSLIQELKNLESPEDAERFLKVYQDRLRERVGPIVPLSVRELNVISRKDLVQVAGWDSTELQERIRSYYEFKNV